MNNAKQPHFMPPKTFLLLGTALLAGCITNPDYKAPDIALPQTWGQQASLQQGQPLGPWSGWWKAFGDPTLNQLVQDALDENLEIAMQTARVEEYRARLGVSRADRWPTLDAQAQATRERTPATLNPIPGASPSTDNRYALSAVLGYEVDLWGRLRREREAAEALLQESSFARDAVRLQVATDVVAGYFELRAASRQLAITRQTLESRLETLRLQEIRHAAGDIDAFALQQARSELEAVRAELPARVQRKQLLEGALAVLVGMPPEALWKDLQWMSNGTESLQLPRTAPDFLPSNLLERRPDIRAAEAALQAATAGIGATQAQRMPRLNLSALIGTAATSSGDLFTDPAGTWALGATALGPLWDFGRSRSRVETAEARAAQAEALYRLTVTNAFNEVRNALIVYEHSGARAEATRNLVETLEENHRLARIRYDEGYISFLNFLDVERAVLTARIAMEEAQRDQLTSAANLSKALGGGWYNPTSKE